MSKSSEKRTTYVLNSISEWPFDQGLLARADGKLYDINLRQVIDPFKNREDAKDCHKLMKSAYKYLAEENTKKYKRDAEKLEECVQKGKSFYLPLGLYGSTNDMKHVVSTLLNMQDVGELKEKIGKITKRKPMTTPERKKVEKTPATGINKIFEKHKDRVALFLQSSDKDDTGALIDIINGTRVCTGTKAYTESETKEKGHRFGYPAASNYNEDDMENLIDMYIKYSKKHKGKVPASRSRIGGAGSVTRASNIAYVPLDIKERIERYNAGLSKKSSSHGGKESKKKPSKSPSSSPSPSPVTKPTKKSRGKTKKHGKTRQEEEEENNSEASASTNQEEESKSESEKKSKPKKGSVTRTIKKEIKRSREPEPVEPESSESEAASASDEENEQESQQSENGESSAADEEEGSVNDEESNSGNTSESE